MLNSKIVCFMNDCGFIGMIVELFWWEDYYYIIKRRVRGEINYFFYDYVIIFLKCRK